MSEDNYSKEIKEKIKCDIDYFSIIKNQQKEKDVIQKELNDIFIQNNRIINEINDIKDYVIYLLTSIKNIAKEDLNKNEYKILLYLLSSSSNTLLCANTISKEIKIEEEKCVSILKDLIRDEKIVICTKMPVDNFLRSNFHIYENTKDNKVVLIDDTITL